jgi:hypothetical protein
MDLFTELRSDPLEVIGLFPGQLPREVRSRFVYPEETSDLAGTALEKALMSLATYLKQHVPAASDLTGTALEDVGQAFSEDYALVTDPQTIIDTTLLRAYLRTNDTALTTLLRRPNRCHIRECDKQLRNAGKYAELVLLFRGHGLHQDALNVGVEL